MAAVMPAPSTKVLISVHPLNLVLNDVCTVAQVEQISVVTCASNERVATCPPFSILAAALPVMVLPQGIACAVDR